MTESRRTFLARSGAAAFAALLPELVAAQPINELDLDPEANLFLSADFAPVVEELSLTDLRVEGTLPKELNGFFLRNGPNPQFRFKNNYHMFEGDGMIHAVHLENGKASYRNRWVRTAVWKKEHEAKKALYPSVLDPFDWNHAAKSILAGEMPAPNRGNTALVWHHGKLLALWEGGAPHEISLPALETVGEYNFGKKLSHNFTAHPKVDPTTGELVFYGYQPMQPYLQHSVADRSGRITHTTAVPLPRPTMIHDAAITRRHTVFLDTPALFDLSGALSGKPLLKWSPEHGARIGVLPRYAEGTAIKWFDIATCFVFHVFNAYEEGSEIVLHACRFDHYPAIADFSGRSKVKNGEWLLKDARSVAYMWRLNLDTGKVVERALDDASVEFPQVNQNLAGTKTRYGYCTTFTDIERCTFHKYDFETGTRKSHQLGKDRLHGEPIFVPREGAKAEDDGYLLALSYDRVKRHSELVVIRGNDFDSEPVARVVIPCRVPLGFHAAWAPLS
jgi:carotenoid cleavage dioxygenase